MSLFPDPWTEIYPVLHWGGDKKDWGGFPLDSILIRFFEAGMDIYKLSSFILKSIHLEIPDTSAILNGRNIKDGVFQLPCFIEEEGLSSVEESFSK